MNIDELHRNLPKLLPTELGDKMQYVVRSKADQQMRFIIKLGCHIDFILLKKAMRLAIYAEPIFSYFYKEDGDTVYWQKKENIDASLLVDLIEISGNLDSEIDRFATKVVSPFAFPLVKARVIRDEHHDTICINMNHTPTDGTGLKQFVKLLSSIYNKLILDPEYLPEANINGDRSLKQVTKNFTLYEKLSTLRLALKRCGKGKCWSFNWGDFGKDNEKHFAVRTVSDEIFGNIKTICRRYDATVNDVILAIFFRIFNVYNVHDDFVFKPLIVPVDLRKYIRPNYNTAICSLTSPIIAKIGSDIGKTFQDTLIKVRDNMIINKRAHSEMITLAPLMFLSKFVPYEKLKTSIFGSNVPAIPVISNCGIVNTKDIDFNNLPIEDAFILGAIPCSDNFCFVISTFQNKLTFSLGCHGENLQKQRINSFLDNFVKSLSELS